MNFTFQVDNPAGAGMSYPRKQLIQALITMQLSAFLLLALGLQVSAATYSQTVSFTGKDVPLRTVFASVKKQTGYVFFYSEDVLQTANPVTIDVKNIPLETFLKICLKGQQLEYGFEGSTIFITKKLPVVALASPPPTPGDPIIQIKGRVTNDKGEPLVNANITVKRTGHGTVTDANGNFYLKNVNSDDVVSVTFIGYKSVSIPIKDRISLAVVMSATTNDLDKVVVQAYGTTSQRLATGNIGTVSAEQIARQPVANPLLALQGQVAGVVVTQNGSISGTVKIEIRGRNSINPNIPSDPLYIIDGVPLTVLDVSGTSSYASGSAGFIQSRITSPEQGQSPFFNINPQDIESISVLKDADATAIYGSRGANGVILITTKKGKEGKAKFELNVQQGTSHVIKYFNMLNTPQYVEMRKEALRNDGLPLTIDNAPDLLAWDTTRYTNWQKYSWGRSGKITDVQGNFTGGDHNGTFRIGGFYRDQQSIQTVSGAYQKGGVSFDFNRKSLNEKFSLSFGANYSYTAINSIYAPNVANFAPNAPAVFNKAGQLNFSGWAPLQGLFPFGSLLQPYTSKTNLLLSHVGVVFQIAKGLVARATLGYNNFQNNQRSLTPIASQDPLTNPKGTALFGTSLGHQLLAEPQVEYNGFIGKGKINVLAGASDQIVTTDGTTAVGQGYTNDELLGTVSNAPSRNSFENYAEYKYGAIFGRLNYNWQDKYILNVNIRRDGSSRFGPGKEYGNFGSIGAAYIFTETNWMQNNIKFLSFGKIRASYGTTGSDNIGNYQYLTLWSSAQTYTYNGILPVVPQGHSDSLLHWEVNKKTEVAINLGFLKDHVNIEIVRYINRCNDQLVTFPTPYFTGFNGLTSNKPADVENGGWEFSLSTKNIEKKSFSWISNLNIGINRNRLLGYPNLSQSPYAGSLVIGQSINLLKRLRYIGVDPQTGVYAFQDKNKDGQIVTDPTSLQNDLYYYDPSTKFDGGFTNTFTYKNWNLSLFFYFRKQLGLNILASVPTPGTIFNEPTTILQRWQKPGDISQVAAFTTGVGANFNTYNNFQSNSDGTLTDASFIRLQNAAISYNLPIGKLHTNLFKSCLLSILANNLFVITSYNGLDPETQSFGAPPIARSVTLKISATF